MLQLEKLFPFLFPKEEKRERKIIPKAGTTEHEIEVLKAEIKDSERLKEKRRKRKYVILKVGVSKFDELIADKGLERGSTILISGGCGTGKTTFSLQSLYYGAKHNQKGIYISFEEEIEKIKLHMKKNFGWDFYKLEEKGLIKFIQLDPIKVARKVEALRAKEAGTLRIEIKPLVLPFVPDRIAVDSLSALSIAFEDEENYRKYVRTLFETLESYNSINFVLTETEQNPVIYSRAGIEEFLADGVVVLYNLKIKDRRENALEILKLRSSAHVKRLIPYKITSNGFEIYPEKRLQLEFL
ncbi:hypothetical protein DRJ19_04900 [Candidatus Woesearchaeota archaeon]|nr:MAG: hypothetical protein DRJ19_04900 [Candidatus Woesearchaeota archaeon]